MVRRKGMFWICVVCSISSGICRDTQRKREWIVGTVRTVCSSWTLPETCRRRWTALSAVLENAPSRSPGMPAPALAPGLPGRSPNPPSQTSATDRRPSLRLHRRDPTRLPLLPGRPAADTIPIAREAAQFNAIVSGMLQHQRRRLVHRRPEHSRYNPFR